ncbi:MAG: hypothetical protein K2Y01_07040 [Rhabdochlamydiaceae bacterium]|nr:hypothetical protein [Rhabdochlamydiaceae bacterium]
MQPPRALGRISDVDMDALKVVVGHQKVLETSGVGPCFPICARGLTAEGVPVLGLAHTCVAIEDMFSRLKSKMLKKNCLEDTLETFVVGGESPNRTNPEGSVEDEIEIAKLVREYKTKELLFNFVNAQSLSESLGVVLTPDLIYVNKERGDWIP